MGPEQRSLTVATRGEQKRASAFYNETTSGHRWFLYIWIHNLMLSSIFSGFSHTKVRKSSHLASKIPPYQLGGFLVELRYE